MSPRYLKTKYPCKECGEPALVCGTWEKDTVRCDRCLARLRAGQRIGWMHESGQREINAVNGKADEPELVCGWLKGIAKHLEGSARRMEEIGKFTPARRRKLMAGVVSWVGWARENLALLEPMIEDLAALETLPVIDGGPDQRPLDLPTPEVARERPSLRLVKREGP